MRVPAFLAKQSEIFETILHPPAFTAQKRARFLRVSGSHVAKSVLLVGPSGYLLAVLPATRQIDTDELGRDLGGPVRVATDREVAEVFSDCEWGVVPPFGRLYGLNTLLDATLDPETLMVFETSSRAQAVRMRCRDFERLEKPRRVPFAR